MKKEPWRIIVGAISIAYIVFLWIRKDILSIYVAMPGEQAIPLIFTTIAVSVMKIAAIAGIILLIKWLASKIR
jgi:hypothetical protein